MSDLIHLQAITKQYQMGDTLVRALDGVDLTIAAGDFVAIMGPSGSGKSTLMHLLGLLDVPTTGSYQLNGRETSKLSEDELAVLRREEVGFIFQQFNLLPRLDAAENVALPLLYSRRHGREGAGAARRLLELVGLGPRAHHRPNELSGGQQQRVAIARSLVNQPRVIFADEPTGNLDSTSERDIMKALHDLHGQGITVIVVTHEEEIGAQASRVIRMRDGKIQSDERRERLRARALTDVAPKSPPAARPILIEILEHFRLGYRTLAGNKVRTALSMLGIMIGVAAVVAMLALGRGAQAAIESQLSSLGSNLLVLRPGQLRVGGVAQESGAPLRLAPEDAQTIRDQVPGVKDAAGALSGRVQVTFANKNWSTQVQGAAPAYARMHDARPPQGRFFTEDENRMRARVAVIGATVVRELFGDASPAASPIGEMIKVNKVSFQVIGVLPAKGATGWRDQDDVIIVPVLTAMHRLLGKTWVDYIDIEAESPEVIDSVQARVVELMTQRHRVPLSQSQDAFQVNNMADLQAALASSSQTMAMLLASIAAISLIVGGIGIMNIMLVSVTERTKEIGLRKAIGARRADILLQFLAESVVVSAIGGVAGIVLGWLITVTLSAVSGWATSVSPQSVFLAFFFSAGIGVVFGIYPARKASALHPIQALRYE